MKFSNPIPSEEVSVKNLIKKVGELTLRTTFEVRPRERLVVTGQSGIGKTTLLRVLSGLEPIRKPEESGEIYLGTQNITDLSPQERNFGLVFQGGILFEHLSVLENASFGLRMRGASRYECEALVLPWLNRLGLKKKCHLSAAHLSGGEKQRVAFVRALVWKPRALLLDEPFSALDQDLKNELYRELLDLHMDWPVPLILVTHDESDVRHLATNRLELRINQNSEIYTVSR